MESVYLKVIIFLYISLKTIGVVSFQSHLEKEGNKYSSFDNTFLKVSFKNNFKTQNKRFLFWVYPNKDDLLINLPNSFLYSNLVNDQEYNDKFLNAYSKLKIYEQLPFEVKEFKWLHSNLLSNCDFFFQLPKGKFSLKIFSGFNKSKDFELKKGESIELVFDIKENGIYEISKFDVIETKGSNEISCKEID